jgi:hypothetical protein
MPTAAAALHLRQHMASHPCQQPQHCRSQTTWISSTQTRGLQLLALVLLMLVL